jgi:modulator of FtsH protease HflK
MPAPNWKNAKPINVTNLPRGVFILGFWVLVALIFLWTGFYTVPAESVGVVQRFGGYLKTVEAGLQFKIPYGVDQVTIVPVRRQLKMEFGFESRAGGTNPYQESKEAPLERAMVTGDLNAALVEWVVQYRVSTPRDYLFTVADSEETMRAAAEAVMREVVGDRTVDEVITIGRQEIESECQIRLQKVAQAYQLGLAIDHVQLKSVNPPREVQASFNEVNQAQQEKQRMINVANGEYNKAVPRARGEAARRIDEARGTALKRVNEAEGDAQRFTAVFTEYKRAPEVTRQRLYLETMGKVLPQVGRKVIVDDKGQQILPLLQLDK